MTAELALALPTLIVLLAIGLWLQSTLALKARCLDAARAGARAAARGDGDPVIRSELSTALPAGAVVRITRAAGQVTVVIAARAAVPAGLSALVTGPAVTTSATASAEPAR